MKKLLGALHTTIVSIILTILPIFLNIVYNVFLNNTWHSNITYAVAMSFAYSLIVPCFIGLFSKNTYRKIHKTILGITGLFLMGLYTIAIVLNKLLFDNCKYYLYSFEVMLILSVALLFWTAYRDETDKNADAIIYESDNNIQIELKNKSKNNKDYGGNNE